MVEFPYQFTFVSMFLSSFEFVGFEEVSLGFGAEMNSVSVVVAPIISEFEVAIKSCLFCDFVFVLRTFMNLKFDLMMVV